MSALTFCLLIGASVGCTPVSASTSDRDNRSREAGAPATAEEIYQSYIDASNAIDLANPKTFKPIAKFTSSRYYADLLATFTARRESGQVQGGEMTVEYFRVQTVIPGVSVEATACLDVSRVTLVDRYGESVLSDDSPQFLESYAEFRSDTGGLLLDGQFIEPIERCPAPDSKALPVAPAPDAPGQPEPDEPARNQDESYTSYPDDVTICGGWHG